MSNTTQLTQGGVKFYYHSHFEVPDDYPVQHSVVTTVQAYVAIEFLQYDN